MIEISFKPWDSEKGAAGSSKLPEGRRKDDEPPSDEALNNSTQNSAGVSEVQASASFISPLPNGDHLSSPLLNILFFICNNFHCCPNYLYVGFHSLAGFRLQDGIMEYEVG